MHSSDALRTVKRLSLCRTDGFCCVHRGLWVVGRGSWWRALVWARASVGDGRWRWVGGMSHAHQLCGPPAPLQDVVEAGKKAGPAAHLQLVTPLQVSLSPLRWCSWKCRCPCFSAPRCQCVGQSVSASAKPSGVWGEHDSWLFPFLCVMCHLRTSTSCLA